MTALRPVDMIELEVDRCTLTYGVAPCQAALGVTGSVKCYNSLSTCQDLDNISLSPYRLRFVTPLADLPLDPAFSGDGLPLWFPSLVDVAHTPVKPDPGESIGVRASLRVTLQDHPYHDILLDKYQAERGFDPATRSTLWAKLLVRYPWYVGRKLRWYRGDLGQPLGQWTVRHYVMERITGPDQRGRITITAKDPLKLADNDRAQAPRPSKGTLAVAIANTGTPTQIDVTTPDPTEYPAGGGVIVIGREVIQYASATAPDATTARLSTITRAAPGGYQTELAAHDVGDAVQLALHYDAARLPDIAHDLLLTYAGLDAAWLPKADWDDEYDTWLPGLTLTRLITEPEGVRDLLDEITSQTLTWAFWWDEAAALVRYRALRPPDVSEAVPLLTDDGHLIADTVERIDDPGRVQNQVEVIYGPVDPTVRRDERTNYRRASVTVDADSQAASQFGQRRIRRVYANWFTAGAGAFADQLAVRLLASYAAKSFGLHFAVPRDVGPSVDTGDMVQVETAFIVDALGLPERTRLQVLRATSDADEVEVEARRDVFSAVAVYARIAPGSLAGLTWAAATAAQRQRYMFIADAAGKMSDGTTDGYKLL